MLNDHGKNTIWVNMFGFFSGHLKQTKESFRKAHDFSSDLCSTIPRHYFFWRACLHGYKKLQKKHTNNKNCSIQTHIVRLVAKRTLFFPPGTQTTIFNLHRKSFTWIKDLPLWSTGLLPGMVVWDTPWKSEEINPHVSFDCKMEFVWIVRPNRGQNIRNLVLRMRRSQTKPLPLLLTG